MKMHLGLLVILSIMPTLVSSQTETPNTTQSHSQKNRHVTITGCLSKTPHGEYELVDQKGVHNLVYKSERVDLDSHVGQSVTLTGDRSATPGTDTGTARPMPHFIVRELRPASGTCGQ